MSRMRYWFWVLMLIPVLVLADKNRQAYKSLLKGKFEKTEEVLQKSLEKDSINPGAKYVYSMLFSVDSFPRYNIDTAYYFIVDALLDYDKADEEILEELEKNEFLLTDFEAQKGLVDSLAFAVALDSSSVDWYNRFLDIHTTAKQRNEAIANRNALAFESSRKKHTWQHYLAFMETYPEAIQYKEANSRYQLLVFEDKTRDSSLDSYINFLKEHPNSPYRKEVEKEILELKTLNNHPEDYLWFLSHYPGSYLQERASNILFHLDKDFYQFEYFDRYAAYSNRDSLIQIRRRNETYIVPVWESGYYGFITLEGKTYLDTQFETIHEDYLCGNPDQDYLEVIDEENQKIVNRNGQEIFVGSYEESEDLGGGLIKIKTDDHALLLHKSGWIVVEESFDDFELLDGKLIKYQQNRRWGLMSMFGRKLTQPRFDNIMTQGIFWIFEKDDRFDIHTAEQLIPALEEQKANFEFRYDDTELVNSQFLICYNDDKESLVDGELNQVIAPAEQQIYSLLGNWMVKRGDGILLYRRDEEAFVKETYEDLKYNTAWLAVKKDNRWNVFSQGYGIEPRFGLDSIKILNDQLIYVQNQVERQVLFPNRKVLLLKEKEEIKMLGLQIGGDSSQYLLVTAGQNMAAYDMQGETLFSGRKVNLDFLTSGFFIYEERRKQGIMNEAGKIVLRPRYDGIGNVKDSLAPVLLNQKFGAFDLTTNTLIEPKYDISPVLYNRDFVIVNYKGKKGLIDRMGKRVLANKYQDIEFWSDSTALVREELHWQLFDFDQDEVILDEIQSFKFVRNDSLEKVIIFRGEDGYGVFSSITGLIAAPTYNDLLNLGTPEEPLFFAEKHVAEADFYVVVYLNNKGIPLRRQGFTAEEYDFIYCQ